VRSVQKSILLGQQLSQVGKPARSKCRDIEVDAGVPQCRAAFAGGAVDADVTGTNNRGVHVQEQLIQQYGIVKSGSQTEAAGQKASSGQTFLVLETEWENIHPKQKVDKEKLEGKTDRMRRQRSDKRFSEDSDKM